MHVPHSSTDKNLCCFRILADVNNATVSVGVQTPQDLDEFMEFAFLKVQLLRAT